jgi:hypothetical protein
LEALHSYASDRPRLDRISTLNADKPTIA